MLSVYQTIALMSIICLFRVIKSIRLICLCRRALLMRNLRIWSSRIFLPLVREESMIRFGDWRSARLSICSKVLAKRQNISHAKLVWPRMCTSWNDYLRFFLYIHTIYYTCKTTPLCNKIIKNIKHDSLTMYTKQRTGKPYQRASGPYDGLTPPMLNLRL